METEDITALVALTVGIPSDFLLSVTQNQIFSYMVVFTRFLIILFVVSSEQPGIQFMK